MDRLQALDWDDRAGASRPISIVQNSRLPLDYHFDGLRYSQSPEPRGTLELDAEFNGISAETQEQFLRCYGWLPR